LRAGEELAHFLDGERAEGFDAEANGMRAQDPGNRHENGDAIELEQDDAHARSLAREGVESNGGRRVQEWKRQDAKAPS
jgi:hypothetical protein